MSSDFSNLSEAGKSCAGCGKSRGTVLLFKLPSYSRAYACPECSIKYAACANLSPTGKKCNHPPHLRGPCHCGCPEYLHSLVDEVNRQFAACVGLEARTRECSGYGQVECHRLVFIDPTTGDLPRLCESCMRGWVNAVKEGQREAEALLKIKTDVELPN